jgi:hypothetical protein
MVGFATKDRDIDMATDDVLQKVTSPHTNLAFFAIALVWTSLSRLHFAL